MKRRGSRSRRSSSWARRTRCFIDAQWTLSSAHRLIAEILDTGKNLTTIYLTHAHPDHYFGAGVIAEAFPNARVVAIASEADIINKQFFGKIEIWESTIGAHNVCRKTTHVDTLAEDHIELEGQRLEIISKVVGDMKYNTMVWIPSIKTLYASDVLFNQAHPFTCELLNEELKEWGDGDRQDREDGRRGDHPRAPEAGHAVRQELARLHP